MPASQNPNARKPGRAETWKSGEECRQLRPGVADVREEGEAAWGKAWRVERGTEMGPGADEPDGADGGEDEVVEDATRSQKRAEVERVRRASALGSGKG